LALAQRCVSSRTSSRERSNYATISDAFNKLNFSQALHDTNCYPFICQVVGILFEVHYWTLSGSMQTALLRLTDTAKDIAIESRQHTGLILRLIDKQRDTLERGRCKMVTGFSISRLDSKLKTLIGYRAQLIGELQTVRSEDLPLLPDDCWRHILSFLTQPRDVLNLGSVNVKLYSLTSEELVWKNLIKYHYGMHITAADEDTCDGAVNMFRKIYIARRKQLKTLQSDAVALCHLCCCIYWRGYGHPCTASMRTSGLSAGRECTELSITPATADERLTAKQFVELF
jgi:F-box protein 25/32